MEDVAKEDLTQCKEPVFLDKAGWVKKDTGRLLTSYKDRYIHVEKTEVVVFEHEDLKNCLERLDLENYDKCHELKSPFKRKHRLILIRSPKSGNKVHDVKFQAQTVKEKEDWIKALSNGISRAKNKVFDSVKIDESCNLEHVTRTRPKGNRNRRPPTRIHMKEVADVSSDGILRLDLDLEDALMPNGTHHATTDGSETSKEAIKVPLPLFNANKATEKQSGQNTKEAHTESEVNSQIKVIKPPMPPNKEAKPSATPKEEPDKEDEGLMKQVPKLPMPPSKESKPSVSSVEEVTEKTEAEISEKCDDSRKKTCPPPTPPNKPTPSSSVRKVAEASQSSSNSHSPTPPSKENKSSNFNADSGEMVHRIDAMKEALPSVRYDEPVNQWEEEKVSEEKSDETVSHGLNKSFVIEPQSPTDPLRKSPSPLLFPKIKPEKPDQPDTQHFLDKISKMNPTEEEPTASDTSDSYQKEEAQMKNEVPSVIVSLNDLVTGSLDQSPVLSPLHEEKKKKAEEKSVDSGQHSDDDSEGSGTEESLAVSTTAMRGSHAALDALNHTEDDIQISDNFKGTQASAKSQIGSEVFSHHCSEPTPHLMPSAKARSASFGDLLSESSICIHVRQHARSVAGNDSAPNDDVMKLEAEISLEMEKTSHLLSRVSQFERGADGEDMPENLLNKAMEKLMKAEHVLSEVKRLKSAKNSVNRKTW